MFCGLVGGPGPMPAARTMLMAGQAANARRRIGPAAEVPARSESLMGTSDGSPGGSSVPNPQPWIDRAVIAA